MDNKYVLPNLPDLPTDELSARQERLLESWGRLKKGNPLSAGFMVLGFLAGGGGILAALEVLPWLISAMIVWGALSCYLYSTHASDMRNCRAAIERLQDEIQRRTDDRR
jgi:hypothetical protein